MSTQSTERDKPSPTPHVPITLTLEDTTVPMFHSLSPPARLSPTGRLVRLRHALDDVSGHLVEGIADAAAQAVSGAVRDAVLALLRADGQHTGSLQRDRFEALADRQSSLWREEDEPDEPLRHHRETARRPRR